MYVGRNYVQTTDEQTEERTDRQTDDPIPRCPRTFQAGALKLRIFDNVHK